MNKSKRKQDKSKEKKPLITAVLFSFCTILSLLLLFPFLDEYRKSAYQYESLIYREYSFERVERVSVGRGEWQNLVYVKEEEKPLLVDVLLSSESVEMGLESLEVGDNLFCYVSEEIKNKECIGELVEIKAETIIFSLEEYTEKNRQDAMWGAVGIPTVACVCFMLSTWFFTLHIKDKNRKPDEE